MDIAIAIFYSASAGICFRYFVASVKNKERLCILWFFYAALFLFFGAAKFTVVFEEYFKKPTRTSSYPGEKILAHQDQN